MLYLSSQNNNTMKNLILTLTLFIGIVTTQGQTMLPNTDTTENYSNPYLVRAGMVGKFQFMVQGLTLYLTNHFAKQNLYNEVKVFGTAGTVSVLIMEWRKNTLLQKAGKM